MYPLILPIKLLFYSKTSKLQFNRSYQGLQPIKLDQWKGLCEGKFVCAHSSKAYG